MLAINGGRPIRNKPIYYGHQYIDQADIEAVTKVLKSEYLTCGPKILELEEKLKNFTKASYAVAVSSGTAALHAACYAAGISKGDEVITTPMTFAASSNCVLYQGARPVFADICSETFNLSPDEVIKNITPKTKAVIAVDFTGQAAELDRFRNICDEHNLILIEDAAHSIGTKYKGKAIGGISDFTTFSFHPVKTVTSGEGGAILTNRKEWADRLRIFCSHGITKDSDQFINLSEGNWYYEQLDLGYNYRMTDIQAALLISQLSKLEQFSNRRKEIVKQYNEAFQGIPGLVVQKEFFQSDTVRHLYLVRLDLTRLTVDRKHIFNALQAENIYCNVHYIPIYLFPYYQKLGYQKGLCPNAEALYREMITLPLYYSMTAEDVNDVIQAVRKVIKFYGK